MMFGGWGPSRVYCDEPTGADYLLEFFQKIEWNEVGWVKE